jgi:3-phosphoinositide dependent protein kinase-1
MTNSSTTEEQKIITKEDFEFGRELGKGAYSVVYLTTFKKTGEKFATKSIEKNLIIKENKLKTVKIEKDVLQLLKGHPNIIKLFCTFQDKTHLYFALEYAPGGEMFDLLVKHGPFSLEATRFYAAEIVNGLEFIHSKHVIHRDMKPENLILDANMHLKITDFGTARILEKGKDMIMDNSDIQKRPSKQTFCGTANYVSPEMLNNGPCKIGSDLWALGCIIYQFLTGVHIFTGDSDYLIFQKILNRQIDFPESFPPAAKSLIEELLLLDPDDRLGARAEGYKELKAHPFFNGIDWNNLHKQTPPRIKPETQLATLQPKDTSKWNLFLLKNEKIAFSSLVIKHRRMTSKKRQLILTDRPRFFYVDETKMSLKGFIPWSKDIRVVVKSSKDFIIQTPTRKYIMEDQFNNADQWAKCINAMLSSTS